MAKDELKKGYKRWNDAYSGMLWTEYLKRIRGLGWTGEWVKEVAAILEDGDVD